MDIRIGELYKNKTWGYLLPCLKEYGQTFESKFNKFFKLGYGIHDTLLDGAEIVNDKAIFIMIDTKYKPEDFKETLNWFKFHESYITDYCPEADIRTARKHILVLRIPPEYGLAYNKFVEGRYGEMYLEEDISILFSISDKSNIRQEYIDVIKRDKKAKDLFIKKVKAEYNAEISLDDIERNKMTLDLPLKRTEEMFNCDSEERKYFNPRLDRIFN